MKAVFVLREYGNNEVIDVKSNIERAKRIMNLKSRSMRFNDSGDACNIIVLKGRKKYSR